MFVRKSTHDAVLTELSGVKAANRLLIAERNKLQRELATTYVRDSKGRMARHSSAAK